MFKEDEQKFSVLVVDDDLFMRGMLQNLLEEQGYTVIQAENGAKAIDTFKIYSPDLVLLDAAMPVMDGFTACYQLKQMNTSIDVPVIMITSLDDEASVDKAFTVGAVEYITKPVHWAVLRHRVKVILEGKRAQVALRKSENRFRGIFEQAAMGIALVDMSGKIVHHNPALQQMLGHTTEHLEGKNFNKLFYPADTAVEKEFYLQLLSEERPFYQMEKYFFHHQNSPMLWGRITTSLVRDANDKPQYLIHMVENITERKRAQTKQRLATKVFETTTDSVLITDANGAIIDVNQAFIVTTGYSYDEVLDKKPRFLQSGRHEALFYETLWASLRETGRWRGEIYNRRKSGEIYAVWLSISAIRGEHNEITHYVAVYSDMRALRDDAERMRLLTHYDSLTELPNRLLFHEQLTRACRQDECLALLYLDLDNFRQINEHFGYVVGDEFLKTLAKQLRKVIRDGDMIARLEGDEFALILSPIHQDYDVRLLAEKLFELVTQAVFLEGHEVQVNCNIGIAFYRPNHDRIEEDGISVVEKLIQQADMAMYLAKESGKNTFYIFDEHLLANMV
ncbi:PAS domain S-box/diguanylate cyclase (GGDEF) domain-containing protein [Beggiatoa alba B18LD]|uniref:PAS domain S-box/diguanylate cyclase (GGDEF) domain-containing protein n=1 Tax=Beggiatoa alba B18LD TaxID=395493 RepID=I3CKF3_9GAMM|nr:PAS domain S-box protein [Beggiatoa alba]EIJ44096.1 PAS domain S-box/diguanylate cyclase (GGDEF) domain-containing protein [Beggiatoa alba B18LD]